MSRMSDLFIEIEELLAEGMHPSQIAKTLQVPLKTVYDAIETLESPEPEYNDPYVKYNKYIG